MPVIVRAFTAEGVLVHALTFTQTVNMQGGLLEATFKMKPGQELTLVHLHSEKEALCRVMRVDTPSEGSFPTTFEFAVHNMPSTSSYP
jgi:hypothetical protein